MASYTIMLDKVLKKPVSRNRLFPEIMRYKVDYAGTIDPKDNMTFVFYPGSNIQVYPCGHPKYNS
jgi:hypothetical protein